MEYILICAQKYKEETQSILIPYNDLPEERKNQWLKLKKYITLLYDEKNVILLNYIRKKKNNHTYLQIDKKNKELYNLCNIFLIYMKRGHYFFKINNLDKKWVKNSIKNLCDDYDHVENYKNLLKTDQ